MHFRNENKKAQRTYRMITIQRQYFKTGKLTVAIYETGKSFFIFVRALKRFETRLIFRTPFFLSFEYRPQKYNICICVRNSKPFAIFINVVLYFCVCFSCDFSRFNCAKLLTAFGNRNGKVAFALKILYDFRIAF